MPAWYTETAIRSDHKDIAMPTPPITREMVDEVFELMREVIAEGYRIDGMPSAFEEAGKRGIARGMFSTVRGLRHRYEAGQQRFGLKPLVAERKRPVRVLNDEFTAPEIPSDDEDLDEIVARMAANQAKRYAKQAASEWMRFDVKGDKPFALAFIGDPHIDTSDIARLIEHVDIIKSTDRMWAVGLGDWINGWSQKLRGQYAQQAVTERDAIRLARWLLQQEIWMLILLGNHDGERWHGQMNPLRWIETACPVDVIDWQVKFKVACGGRDWKIWAAHNFPGNSQYNVGHGPKKRAIFTGAEADIYIAGDRHTFMLAQDQHEHTGRVYWTARARGYKPIDMYATELGYGDAGGQSGIGHSIGAVFDPRNGSLVCFAELDKAAAYLKSLG
jgi:Calcineurin-like phosphoesterase